VSESAQATVAQARPEGMRRSQVWSTRDLALAAFCLEHGLEVVRATRRGREFEFLFRDADSRGNDLAVAFTNSPEARFDAAMRALKKLCHRSGGRG